MASSVASLTRQLSNIDLAGSAAAGGSQPKPARPGHAKQPSQPEIAKLLTKMAPPNLPSKAGGARAPPGLSTAGRAANAGSTAAGAAVAANTLRKQASAGFKPSSKLTHAASSSSLQAKAAKERDGKEKEKERGPGDVALGRYDGGLADSETPPIGDTEEELEAAREFETSMAECVFLLQHIHRWVC
jgi:hypothetical protein